MKSLQTLSKQAAFDRLKIRAGYDLRIDFEMEAGRH